MSKKLYIPLQLNSGTITIDNRKAQMILPTRCEGILFAFKTKTAARNFMGKDCEFIEIEIVKKGKPNDSK